MAETYTIKRVKPEAKPWNSAYGPMVTWTVLFEGRETPVEINKKPDSPKPATGDEVYGHIERTEYGDKFKSDQKPFSGGGGSKGFTPSAAKAPMDQSAMYLSYAKDIAIAMLEKGKLDEAAYGQVLDAVLAGGQTLFEGKPSGVAAAVAESDAEVLEKAKDAFGDEDDDPWEEPVIQQEIVPKDKEE